MSFASIGGFSYLGTYSAGNSYGSFPWAIVDGAGNKHVVYRDWDQSIVGAHSTGGAGWYKRNNVVPVKQWTAAGEGAQIQDTWVLTVPGSATNLVFILRLYKSTVTTNYKHRFAVSNNLGVNIPAMADMTLPSGTGWTASTVWAFSDFLLSEDGTKWYGAAYDEAGNCYLLESTNGTTWSKKSNLDVSGDYVEPALIRFPDGRIVCTLRNLTNTLPGATCYSDNDGVSWSASIQPSANAASSVGDNFCIASPGRGRAVNEQRAVILARYLSGTGFVWHAQWVIDEAGAYVSGPVRIADTDPAAGGYFCFDDDGFCYGYTDLTTNGGDAMAFKAPIRFVA